MIMAITVYPVTPSFAAEIGDVDLARPIDSTDLQAIKDAFTQHAVLDLSRSTSLAGSASRLREILRPAGDHHRRLSKGCAAASTQGVCRRFQPESRQRGVGQGKQTPLVPIG